MWQWNEMKIGELILLGSSVAFKILVIVAGTRLKTFIFYDHFGRRVCYFHGQASLLLTCWNLSNRKTRDTFYTSRVFQWKSIIIDSSLLFSLFFIILILCNKQNADGQVLLIWVRVIGKTILVNNLLTKALILKSLCTWVFDYYVP